MKKNTLKKVNGEELVALLKSDTDAQFELYQDVYTSVKGKCIKNGYQRFLSEDDIRDVVNDIYYNIINSLDTYDTSRDFNFWKFAIIRNTLYSALTRVSKHSHISYDEGFNPYDDGLDTDSSTSYSMDAYMYRNGANFNRERPDDELVYSDLVENLKSLLDERSFNVIKFLSEDYTYEHISQMMGLSLKNLRTIRSRTKKKVIAYHLVG